MRTSVYISFCDATAQIGPREPLVKVSRSNKDSPHMVRLLFTRDRPNNIQLSQEIDIHEAGGIRARSPSDRAAANLRLIPSGHRDRIRLHRSIYRGADKSLARPGRKEATATEEFDVHISYLLS